MRLGVRKEILAILEKQKALTSISTADMNKMLRAHFEAEVRAHAAEDAARRPAVFALADNPIEVEEVKQVLLRSAQKGVAAVASGKSKDEVLMEMGRASDDLLARAVDRPLKSREFISLFT